MQHGNFIPARQHGLQFRRALHCICALSRS
jgi:hypothetical protein